MRYINRLFTYLLTTRCMCACVLGSERQSDVPRRDSHRHHYIPGQQEETNAEMVSHLSAANLTLFTVSK